MRLFIALTLDESLRTRLALRALELTTLLNSPRVAWAASGASSLHVTLKFLGETDVTPAALASVLRPVVEPEPPFHLVTRGTGAFPSPERARVLWAGMPEGHEALVRLATGIDRACTTLGFEPETRPFSGHITLARTRHSVRHANASPAIQAAESETFGEMTVREVTLYSSELGKGGAKHTVLWKIPLTGGA